MRPWLAGGNTPVSIGRIMLLCRIVGVWYDTAGMWNTKTQQTRFCDAPPPSVLDRHPSPLALIFHSLTYAVCLCIYLPLTQTPNLPLMHMDFRILWTPGPSVYPCSCVSDRFSFSLSFSFHLPLLSFFLSCFCLGPWWWTLHVLPSSFSPAD